MTDFVKVQYSTFSEELKSFYKVLCLRTETFAEIQLFLFYFKVDDRNPLWHSCH